MSRGAGQPKSGRVLFDICAHCTHRWRECCGTCRPDTRAANAALPAVSPSLHTHAEQESAASCAPDGEE